MIKTFVMASILQIDPLILQMMRNGLKTLILPWDKLEKQWQARCLQKNSNNNLSPSLLSDHNIRAVSILNLKALCLYLAEIIMRIISNLILYDWA